MTRYLIVSTALMAVVAACSDADFQTSTAESSATGATAPPAPTSDAAPSSAADRPSSSTPTDRQAADDREESWEAEDEFTLATVRRPVDMVWVIDNSASMEHEIAKVRTNFRAFLSALAGRADVAVTVISTTQTRADLHTYPFTLPADLRDLGHAQIDFRVDSSNGPAIAAMASVPDAGDRRLPEGLRSQAAAVYRPIVGALVPRFRPAARRVYVFVTDDDAREVDADNFLDIVDRDEAGAPPTVFGFVGMHGKNGTDCVYDQRGGSYEALAAKTSGKVFDLCATDWTSYFGALSESTAKLASNRFTLSRGGARTIVSVRQDDQVLEPTSYSLEAGVLAIAPEALDLGGGSIRVTYRHTGG